MLWGTPYQDLWQSALYAIPNGVAGWTGHNFHFYVQTSATKIIENVIQGVVLAGLLAAFLPYGWVPALVVVLVKAKNVYYFATVKQ